MVFGKERDHHMLVVWSIKGG